MNLHEYQAREILSRYGIAVPRGTAAASPEEAAEAAREVGGSAWVLKAQIHAGGRGKAGGVRLCRSVEEVSAEAARMLASRLATVQTGPEGLPVRKVLVVEAVGVASEYYAGVVLDRSARAPVAVACAAGGVEIEDVAARSPEAIVREPFSAVRGLEPYRARWLAKRLGVPQALLGAFSSFFTTLARAFLETDASLAEVNPLAVTADGRLLPLDTKWVLDDNALFRHPELASYRDPSEEDPTEVRAARFDLSYVRLDGNVGCLVNGAGLAMATLDLVRAFGGLPANFLDVGGGASAEKVAEAFRIILEDPRVEAILVNIFGGIMKCDVIATGILAALKGVPLNVPLVVRLEGTNVSEGREMLRNSGLPVTLADGLSDAARKAVALAGGTPA
ncbi:MAG: ADP-forming succinate--CoA ligase subunit beta [Planctomycetota bacterium]